MEEDFEDEDLDFDDIDFISKKKMDEILGVGEDDENNTIEKKQTELLVSSILAGIYQCIA